MCGAVGLYEAGGSLWITGSQWDQQELSFTLYVAKMTQNAFKMQVKTRHAHKKGALGYLEGQICPEKGPKTLFGQMWFAFSFIVLEKGSKRAHRSK